MPVVVFFHEAAQFYSTYCRNSDTRKIAVVILKLNKVVSANIGVSQWCRRNGKQWRPSISRLICVSTVCPSYLSQNLRFLWYTVYRFNTFSLSHKTFPFFWREITRIYKWLSGADVKFCHEGNCSASWGLFGMMEVSICTKQPLLILFFAYPSFDDCMCYFIDSELQRQCSCQVRADGSLASNPDFFYRIIPCKNIQLCSQETKDVDVW